MQSPPIQFTMASHCDEIQRSSRWIVKSVGGAALALAFFTGTYLAYVYAEDTPPPVHAQVSAVAQALPESAFSNLSLLAHNAVVIDMNTRRVEFETNADVQVPLASLTKVPLMLVVSDVLPLDTVVTIQQDTGFSSKAQTLKAGSTWLAKDLMSYTLVASSNDGAEVLANAADEPLREKFSSAPRGGAAVWRMNNLMQELGFHSIYFLNPSGLDMSETQSGAYGSARDVAKLFTYAATAKPGLFEATALQKIVITSREGLKATAENTDQALENLSGIIMGKTGYTDMAGGNLAVIFEAHGHRYVAVVLGSTQQGRFSDMQQLVSTVQNTPLIDTVSTKP